MVFNRYWFIVIKFWRFNGLLVIVLKIQMDRLIFGVVLYSLFDCGSRWVFKLFIGFSSHIFFIFQPLFDHFLQRILSWNNPISDCCLFAYDFDLWFRWPLTKCWNPTLSTSRYHVFYLYFWYFFILLWFWLGLFLL